MSQADTTRLRIVRPEDGEAYWLGENRIVLKAGTADTDGHYGLIESHHSVGSSPPLHVHHGVDEGVWVARGQIRFRCGERDFTAGPGTFVLLPRDVPHTFLVEGDEDAVLVGLLSPGGSEGFFADAGQPATTPTPPPGPPDLERVARASAKWNTNSTVGPPLSPAGESKGTKQH